MEVEERTDGSTFVLHGSTNCLPLTEIPDF